MRVLPYDEFTIGADRLVVTKSRPAEKAGDKLTPPPAEVKKFIASFGLRPNEVYLASVAGTASAAFLDGVKPTSEPNSAGYQIMDDIDALFGPTKFAKACWLGDCGFLLIAGTSHADQPFNGLIHTTRLNLAGDKQFKDQDNRPRGGLELMLRKMLAYYQPRSLRLTLAAGIAPRFYIHEFEQGRRGEQKIEAAFRGWREKGWIRRHVVNGNWDGKSYEADLYAAIRHQVERAGLLSCYDDGHVRLNGDPASGHASHRAAARGLIAETRDLYLLMPR